MESDNYSSEKFFIKHSDGFTDDLIAENESERSEWIKCICEVCGLSKRLVPTNCHITCMLGCNFICLQWVCMA